MNVETLSSFARSLRTNVLFSGLVHKVEHHLLDSHGVAAHFSNTVATHAQSLVLNIFPASVRHQSQVIQLIVIIFILVICINILLFFFVLCV